MIAVMAAPAWAAATNKSATDIAHVSSLVHFKIAALIMMNNIGFMFLFFCRILINQMASVLVRVQTNF